MFKKILVPLDQSPLAEEALGTATALALASQGELRLVLAHPMAPYDGSMVGSWRDAKNPTESVYIRRAADEIARGARIAVDGKVSTGSPVDVICRRAREIDADLIVMTSHGRTGLSRAWLGSVADGVVRQAAVPVLMLRSAGDAGDRVVPLFRRILVPLDGSTTSSAVIETAVSLAQCGGGRLILVRVIAPVPIYFIDAQLPGYPTSIPDPEATKQLAEGAQDELTELATRLQKEYGIEIETVVELSRNPAEAILSIATAREADLVAMTTHGRGASRLLLGSVTDKVLRGGHLPMLLFHPRILAKVETPAVVAANDAIRRMMP